MAERLTLDFETDQVAKVFVDFYYNKLLTSLDEMHKFYNDASTMVRIDGRTVETATAEMNIQQLVNTLNYRQMNIKTIKSLPFLNNKIHLTVSGSALIKDVNESRMFVETFFLVSQGRAFYVLTDIFQYIDEQQVLHNPDRPRLLQRSLEQEDTPIEELLNQLRQGTMIKTWESDCANKVVGENPVQVDETSGSKDKVREKKVHVDNIPEISSAYEIAKNFNQFVESDCANKIVERLAAYSYRVDEASSSKDKVREKKVHVDNILEISSASEIAKNFNQFVESDFANKVVGENPVRVDEASGSKDEALAKQVHVRDIPSSISNTTLAMEFARFGPVVSGGVVIKRPMDRSFKGYGFVEFEDASSVEKAIQSPRVRIGSHKLRTSRARTLPSTPVQGGRVSRRKR